MTKNDKILPVCRYSYIWINKNVCFSLLMTEDIIYKYIFHESLVSKTFIWLTVLKVIQGKMYNSKLFGKML